MALFDDLLDDPLAARYYLFELTLTKISDGSSETFRFTDRPHGFITEPGDTPANTPYFERLEKAPSLSWSLWGRGGRGEDGAAPTLAPPSEPAFGDAIIGNWDGAYDSLLTDYDWGDATFALYMIGKGFTYADKGTRMVGSVGDFPSHDLERIVIPLRDFRFKLEKDLDVPRYHGIEWALRFNGSGYVSVGDVLDLTSDFSIGAWIYLESTGTLMKIVSKDTGGSGSTWDFRVKSDGTLRFRHTDLSPANNDGTTVLATDTWYFVEVNYDGSDVVITLDGAEEVSSSVTGTMTSSTHDLRFGSGLVGYMHGVSIWSSAVDEVPKIRWAADVGGLTANDGFWPMNDGSGTAVSDTSGNGNNGTLSVSNTPTWITPCEGTTELAGVPKPIVLGEVKDIEPIPVAPANLIYQVHHRDTEEIVDVFDGGGALTFDQEYTDFETFITTQPANPGEYTTHLARGLIRLRSDPTSKLTARVKGDAEGGYVNTAADCVERLVTDFGPLASGDLDSSSFSAFESAQTYVVGAWIPDGGPALPHVDFLLSPSGYHYFNRAGKLFVDRIVAPTGTAVAGITSDSLAMNGIEPMRVERLAKSVTVLFGRTWSPLSEAEVIGIIGTDSDRYAELISEWREAFIPDDDALEFAVDLAPLESAILNRVDAVAEAKRLLGIYGVQRSAYALRWELLDGDVSPADVVDLTYARWDLTGGKKMLVIGLGEESRTLEVWG